MATSHAPGTTAPDMSARLPERPGLELAVRQHAPGDGPSGDFQLVAAGPGDSTTIVLGDAMGHGAAAAPRAAAIRAALAGLAPSVGDPAELLEHANGLLLDEAAAVLEFASAVCVNLDPARGRGSLALAGHPAPLALPGGEEMACAPGLLLGIEPGIDARTEPFALTPGMGILLFTDGLVEARPAGVPAWGSLFGLDRVRAALAEPDEPLDALVARLAERSLRHVSHAPADDMCVLAVRSNVGP